VDLHARTDGVDAGPRRNHSMEAVMKIPADDRPVPPVPHHPAEAPRTGREAPPKEPAEVLGRHKNSGQKDHKGAR